MFTAPGIVDVCGDAPSYQPVDTDSVFMVTGRGDA
jgi:hypothetical protein